MGEKWNHFLMTIKALPHMLLLIKIIPRFMKQEFLSSRRH